MKHDTLNYLLLRIVLIIKHCHTSPRCQISQIDRYQIRTVNIKTRLFFRYPFLTSGLALSVIYWEYAVETPLSKTNIYSDVEQMTELQISSISLFKSRWSF